MKKVILISNTFFYLFLICCQKQPVADFKIHAPYNWTFEPIYFTNRSSESYYFEWDFGDSTTSTYFNTVHYYEKSGQYTVTLTAFSENRKNKDVKIDEITIFQPTDLILNIYKENNTPVEDCLIYLYLTFEDWKSYINKVDSTISDSDGIAVFRNIDPRIYYIDAYKKDINGFWANWETGYKTEPLKKDSINTYDIILKYYDEK